MKKEDKILICELFYGKQMTVADISKETGIDVPKISYALTEILIFRNPDLYVNECIIKQSKINDLSISND